MTIQEAIKSGKPFRRNGWTEWFTYDREQVNNYDVHLAFPLSKDDILANDWMVKP